MDEGRWRKLLESLGLTDADGTFERLRHAWSEPHRHYHTAEHLLACLRTLDTACASAERPDEVELALWFHDAVYRGRGGDDELHSADWARAFVLDAGGERALADRVHSLVLATRHDAVPSDADARLLVDVDLSILGAEEAVFDAYERAVREEYRWVPGPLFRARRRAILLAFQGRDRIFATDALHAALEDRARRNLARAIAAL